MPKADLTNLLADAGGGRRRSAAAPPKPEPEATQPSRRGTKPITVHFPREVRDQIKIAAIRRGISMHQLIAEWFNDGFAKEGLPEIAPTESGEK